MKQILNFPEPSPELYQKIIKRLREKKRRTAAWRMVFFLSLSLLAGGFSFWGAYLIWEALSHSGFIQIISLLFSDYQSLALYWNNYLLAILETLPLLPLLYLLSGCLIFLLALRGGLLNLQKLILKY